MQLRFKKVCFKSFVFLACVLAFSGVSQATIVFMPTDEDMIVESRAIVRAKVLSVESSFDAQRNDVFTYVTLRVKDVLKGELRARKIVLKEAGGTFKGLTSVVHGGAEFVPGEKVLLYLGTWPDGSLRVHNLFLGKYSVVADSQTGKDFVVRAGADAKSVDVLPGRSEGASTERMELSAFTNMVRDRLAAVRDRSDQFEATYYSGVPVLARPQNYEALVQSGNIEAQLPLRLQFNVIGWRWFEFDCGLSVTILTNPDGAPVSNPKADAVAAMTSWETITNTTINLSSAPATTLCSFPPTGENVIVYNNCDGFWSPTTCFGSGALAVTSHHTGSLSKTVNGMSFTNLTQIRISVNPYKACLLTSNCFNREMLAHEIGHAIGLNHSDSSTATMWPIIHFDGRCETLQKDDKQGARFIYPPGVPCP